MNLRARHRRKVLLVFIILWLGPGAAITWLYQHSLLWLQIQSWLAMLFALIGAFAAETPVENER
jgi:hypothetical protein